MSDADAKDRLPETLPGNPLPLARAWFDAAQRDAGQRNPNAMTLATIDESGQPTARVVLCKAFVTDPGYVVFYTNYQSAKGRELDAESRVAAVMHWDALGRQIRIEGRAVRSPTTESDAYFATRGWGSQLGAWGSDQSRRIDSRDALVAQLRERATKLGIELGDSTDTVAAKPPSLPRPPHWGGYRIWVGAIELWVEGRDRIHDRARWERTLTPTAATGFETGTWSVTRLQP